MTAGGGLRRVLTATLLWVAGMVWLQWLRGSAGFHYEFEDDALYHQLLSGLADGGWFANTIHPVHRPSHLPLILILLRPLHWLLGGGWLAVYIIKAVAIGSGSLGVYLLARSQKLAPQAAATWGLIYLLFPPTTMLALSTFRALSLALAPLLFLIWAFSARRFALYVGILMLLLLIREDLALTAVLLSGVAVVRRYPARWPLVTVTACVGWYLVATRLLLPSTLPAHYDQVIYSSNIALSGLSDPTHWIAVTAIFLPLLGLPLLSWETAVGAVGLASILLHKSGFAGNLLHLMTPLVAAAMAGAVVAAGRLQRPHLERWVVAAVLVAHLQPWIPPIVAVDASANGPAPAELSHGGAWSPVHSRYHTPMGPADARLEAVAKISEDAAVTASGHLLPALSPRAILYEYGHRDVDYTDVDWILIEDRNLYSGAGSYITIPNGDLAQHRATLLAGFEVVMERDRVLLMKRVQAVSGLRARIDALMPRRNASQQMKRGVRSPGEDRAPL